MGYLSSYTVKDIIKPISIGQNPPRINKDFPKISVITASYNQGQFLERTILSIINQNYENLEFIIIDGGSSDNSLEIIKKYEKYITYWISEKDNGQADAINKGFKIATGDLLCFQNSDDLFCNNSFKILANYYQINPNFDCYYGDLLFIDAEDNSLEILKTNNFNYKAQILEGMQIFNQSMFFKKSLGEKYGCLDSTLTFVIDYENVLRWSNYGAKFVKVNNLLGAFRLHEAAKTNNLESIRKKEHEMIKNKYLNLFFTNKKPTKLDYLFLRINKLFHFIEKFDFGYILYRFSIKK